MAGLAAGSRGIPRIAPGCTGRETKGGKAKNRPDGHGILLKELLLTFQRLGERVGRRYGEGKPGVACRRVTFYFAAKRTKPVRPQVAGASNERKLVERDADHGEILRLSVRSAYRGGQLSAVPASSPSNLQASRATGAGWPVCFTFEVVSKVEVLIKRTTEAFVPD